MHRVLCFLLVLSSLLVPAPWRAYAGDWPQWRGPGRDGLSPEVPQQLPPKRLLWKQPLMGETYAGVVVAGDYVVVPDQSPGRDVFRCFSAQSGALRWKHFYDNKGEMEFGSAPRATPLIHDGLVYTLGAFGELFALDLATGRVVWQRHLARDFGAKVPTWGYCGSPLIVEGRLVVNPGAAAAGVVALHPKTGEVVWQTPGAPAAYSSFIAGTFGGVLQIVGYEQKALGGWEAVTGRRLWRVVPENEDDYNVGTPVAIGDRVLFATDMNYARLYEFGPDGAANPEPVALNEELAPDTATPVAYKGLVFGPAYGLVCLDAGDGLKTLWKSDMKEQSLNGFMTLVAGNDRLLVFCEDGTLFLVAAEREKCRILGRLSLCGKTWSHPALSNGRLFIRDAKTLYCYAFR
ncbi:MAG: PQQ-binding-like beta-propeller repeat protein [Armatimonadota bacterium]|nr:PQQ-binding-like beta-propeller repeat protein [Armatimonadota bacterium]